MDGQELSVALKAGHRVYGTCVVSSAPQWPKMIAGTGLDFVFLDSEHIVLDRTELSWMCQAYAGLGLAPIVRIPSPDPYRASQMIDGGAAGVVAPYVESAAQVRELRGAVKLRPLKGKRLSRVLSGDERLKSDEKEYLSDYNRSNVCIINIESMPGLDALDEILMVPDVDAVLIGPHDLSINMGIPEQYDHPLFESAVQKVIQKGRDAGVGVGMHYSGLDATKKLTTWARSGMNLIIYSSDLKIVSNTLKQNVANLRVELDDIVDADANADGTELRV